MILEDMWILQEYWCTVPPDLYYIHHLKLHIRQGRYSSIHFRCNLKIYVKILFPFMIRFYLEDSFHSGMFQVNLYRVPVGSLNMEVYSLCTRWRPCYKREFYHRLSNPTTYVQNPNRKNNTIIYLVTNALITNIIVLSYTSSMSTEFYIRSWFTVIWPSGTMNSEPSVRAHTPNSISLSNSNSRE